MIAAIIGFLAPFIPDLIGMGKGWLDHKQEMEAIRLQGELAEKAAVWRAEEVATQSAASDRISARKPHESYGVKLLNAASKQDGKLLWRWSFNMVFLAFAALDWFISSVRPGVTFWLVGMWGAVKAAKLWVVYSITGDFTTVFMNEAAWTPFDQDVLLLVLTFWFGSQARKYALGQGR